MVSRGQKGRHYNPATMPFTPTPQPIHCVLDTNVVLDLLHFADSAALPILHALEAGSLVAWVNAETWLELVRVLTYPALKLDEASAHTLLQRYLRLTRRNDSGIPVDLPPCKDPDDQKFLELAARCGASLLFSKDKALLALSAKTGIPFAILAPQGFANCSPHSLFRPSTTFSVPVPGFEPHMKRPEKSPSQRNTQKAFL